MAILSNKVTDVIEISFAKWFVLQNITPMFIMFQSNNYCHHDIYNHGVVFLSLKRPIFLNHNQAAHITNISRESLKSNWWGSGNTWGRLNKKDGLTIYGDSHVKDKTS